MDQMGAELHLQHQSSLAISAISLPHQQPLWQHHPINPASAPNQQPHGDLKFSHTTTFTTASMAAVIALLATSAATAAGIATTAAGATASAAIPP